MKSTVLKSLFIYMLFFILILLFSMIITLLLNTNTISTEYSDIMIIMFVIGITIFFLFGVFVGNYKQNRGLFFGFFYSMILIMIILLYNYLGLEKCITLQGGIKLITSLLSFSIGGSVGVNIRKIL